MGHRSRAMVAYKRPVNTRLRVLFYANYIK